MARSVTLYKVVSSVKGRDTTLVFTTKTKANAFIIEAMRLDPQGDCGLQRLTFDLDKDGVAKVLNDILKGCNQKQVT